MREQPLTQKACPNPKGKGKLIPNSNPNLLRLIYPKWEPAGRPASRPARGGREGKGSWGEAGELLLLFYFSL
jgi:hypothetical protein